MNYIWYVWLVRTRTDINLWPSRLKHCHCKTTDKNKNWYKLWLCGYSFSYAICSFLSHWSHTYFKGFYWSISNIYNGAYLVYTPSDKDVTRFAKGVLYMHSFRSHFSQSFDRYNNRPTVHACTIAKTSTVCFYWGLIHGPVWHPWVLGWSVNGSNLPGQADSQ